MYITVNICSVKEFSYQTKSGYVTVKLVKLSCIFPAIKCTRRFPMLLLSKMH